MSLALFDVDETLINGDCASLWSSFMVAQGWGADKQAFLQHEAYLMEQYGKGQLDMQEYMNDTLTSLKGRTQQDMAQQVQRFIHEVIAPLVYSDARECLARHRENEDCTVIISASSEHLVAPIAQFLRVNEVLAIGVGMDNGIFTGTTQGVLTYREGKVTRLMELLNQDTSSLTDAHFYSDSHNDLPLLTRAGYPKVINPDAILRQHAQQAGWPIYAWR